MWGQVQGGKKNQLIYIKKKNQKRVLTNFKIDGPKKVLKYSVICSRQAMS